VRLFAFLGGSHVETHSVGEDVQEVKDSLEVASVEENTNACPYQNVEPVEENKLRDIVFLVF